MRFIFFNLIFILFMTCEAFAIIYKRTEYFIDIELSKKQFLINCSGGPKDDNSIIGFHLLDGDTYYLFYYRRVREVKECLKLRKEYMAMIKNHDTIRIVGNHPDESPMDATDRKTSPAPFKRAKNVVSALFIRLQAGGKCKAYFSEDCDLPKNYWGGVVPEK